MKLTKLELKKLIKEIAEELPEEGEGKWLEEADVESWMPLFEDWYKREGNNVEGYNDKKLIAQASFGEGWQESIRNRKRWN